MRLTILEGLSERIGFNREDLVETLDSIIARSIADKVSDIHFRTDEDGVHLSVRFDGMLNSCGVFPSEQAELLFTRLKILGRLVSYQKRVPQDGHIEPKKYTDNSSIDIRIAIAPTVNGEQAVIRILYGSSGLIPLESLGWESESLERYIQVITRKRGVVLLTGPCGSGKTTTIAASLKTLLTSGSINICTVEDPVEYRIPGISQMAVDSTMGLGFAKGVQAWLRHDPDVLVVGEIRDSETADVVIEAGLLGHLVFSTLHGGTVPAVIIRLLDMGIPASTLTASLTAVISQRLVRKICPNCKERTKVIPREFSLVENLKNLSEYYSGRGCTECGNTGYIGRQGIFELVVMNDDLRVVILSNPVMSILKESFGKAATCTLWSQGLKLVEEGMTTPQELLRMIGE